MPIEISKVEDLAADQASLAAAAKLKKPGIWSSLACDSAGLIWGECQGSGASPYRIVCSEHDFGYKCTCPSRKFPCKHVLALMWIRAEGHLPFAAGAPPDWVGDWLARRRPGSASRRSAPMEKTGTGEAPATVAEESAENPETAARAAAQRERLKAAREAAMLSGLDELDTWIADSLQSGLASFLPTAATRCRKIAQRLVDAKAPGLAHLVERLPTDAVRLPDAMRTDALIEDLATLHLVSRAYRNQERLPAVMKADIRQIAGWPLTREALLADTDTLRARDRWMVVSTVVEVQPDNLRRLETWLSRGEKHAAPQFAVLIDFVPVSLGKAVTPYRIGEVIDAELAYFPSAAPLRALVVQQFGATTTGERWPSPAANVGDAIAHLNDALVQRPWSRELPFAAHSARVVDAGSSLWLTDTAAGIGLPLRAGADDLARPLLGLDDMDAFGRWDGHFLSLCLCETSLGRWTNA